MNAFCRQAGGHGRQVQCGVCVYVLSGCCQAERHGNTRLLPLRAASAGVPPAQLAVCLPFCLPPQPTWSMEGSCLKRARKRSHSWAISQRRRSSAGWCTCGCGGRAAQRGAPDSQQRAENSRRHGTALLHTRPKSPCSGGPGAAESRRWQQGSMAAQRRWQQGGAAGKRQASTLQTAVTCAAVGEAQHKVGDAVLARPLLLGGCGHVAVVQLDDLLLQQVGKQEYKAGRQGRQADGHCASSQPAGGPQAVLLRCTALYLHLVVAKALDLQIVDALEHCSRHKQITG